MLNECMNETRYEDGDDEEVVLDMSTIDWDDAEKEFSRKKKS